MIYLPSRSGMVVLPWSICADWPRPYGADRRERCPHRSAFPNRRRDVGITPCGVAGYWVGNFSII